MTRRKTLWPVIMISIFSIASLWPSNAAIAKGGGYSGWQMMPGAMGHGGFGWFGGIFSIIFWVLVLVGLVFLVRWLIQSTGRNTAAGSGNADEALEILRSRYARGEIDKEEFDRKKKDLTGE